MNEFISKWQLKLILNIIISGYYEKLRSKQKFGSERVQSHYASRQSLQRKRRNSHTGVGGLPPTLPEQDFSMITLQNLQMGIAGGKLSAMDYELLKLARRGGVGDFAQLQEAMCRGGFCENVKDYWSGTRGVGIRDQGNAYFQFVYCILFSMYCI